MSRAGGDAECRTLADQYPHGPNYAAVEDNAGTAPRFGCVSSRSGSGPPVVPAMMRRLRSLSSHLRPDDPPQRAIASPASGAPPPDVLRAAADRKFSDAQMKQFLTQGYMVIPIKDVEPDFHETIYQKCGALFFTGAD